MYFQKNDLIAVSRGTSGELWSLSQSDQMRRPAACERSKYSCCGYALVPFQCACKFSCKFICKRNEQRSVRLASVEKRARLWGKRGG